MAFPYPSVQSFYTRLRESEPQNATAPSHPGDGFTEEDVAVTLDPLKREFNLSCKYERYEIGSLIAGPRPITFMGRIVNVGVFDGRNKSQIAAAGWHHLIVRDDTGAICVGSHPRIPAGLKAV
jgi:hypothetical protein